MENNQENKRKTIQTTIVHLTKPNGDKFTGKKESLIWLQQNSKETPQQIIWSTKFKNI